MIELIIEPAQFLIDALHSKTASQLIDIIEESAGCESIATVSIHLTAMDILMQKYPNDFENLITRA